MKNKKTQKNDGNSLRVSLIDCTIEMGKLISDS